MTLVLVMIGAAVGASCRYLLDRSIQARHDMAFPLGTLTINVSGSFVLGVVLTATSAGAAPAQLAALLGAGFCGGFTTYSTFGYETLRLVEQGSSVNALLNIGASVVAGLLAATLGWGVGVALFG